MPIYRLIQQTAFPPEDVEVLAAAFDEACSKLGLAERTDPLRDIVATKIIECAKTGVRDRAQLRDCALEALNR